MPLILVLQLYTCRSVIALAGLQSRVMHDRERKRVLLHFFALFCSCYALGVRFRHYSAAGVKKGCLTRGGRGRVATSVCFIGCDRFSTQSGRADREEELESAQEGAQTPPPPPALPSHYFSSQQDAVLPSPSRLCGKGLLAAQCHLHTTPSRSRLVAARNGTTLFPSLSS